MGRYAGPVCRLCRRHGDKLYLKGERCSTPKCAFEKRPFPPGPRPQRRRKVSDRSLQLREKQKARSIYGVMERQFRRYYAEAMRRPGISGDNLLQILELRLDNLVYRLGFADSRSQARQVVLHGHISVNGRKSGIPSHILKIDDEIGWTNRGERSTYQENVKLTLDNKSIPSWLKLDAAKMTGQVLNMPDPEEVGSLFNSSTIVEYYSR